MNIKDIQYNLRYLCFIHTLLLYVDEAIIKRPSCNVYKLCVL